MCLTWKDLIVIVTNAKGELHRFLQGLIGITHSCYIMAIMGPSQNLLFLTLWYVVYLFFSHG